MTADPATNALILNASPQDFETLKEVIDKLDVRRRQVYVEAIIAEVSLHKTRDLGIEFQGATGLPNGVGLARTNLSGDINSLLTPTSLSGLVLAAASSQTVTVNGVTVPAQQALLVALQTDSDANILSAPTILTTDNQQAEIVSGENVPFIASTSTTAVNLANTFNTIDRARRWYHPPNHSPDFRRWQCPSRHLRRSVEGREVPIPSLDRQPRFARRRRRWWPRMAKRSSSVG